MNMPNLIKDLRTRKNISLEKLAEMIGASTGTLHRLETGSTPLHHKFLPAIAKALDCPAWKIAGLPEDMKSFEYGGDHAVVDATTRIMVKGENSDLRPDAEILPSEERLNWMRGAGIRQEALLSTHIWRVKTGCLDEIGIEPGDFITSMDVEGYSPKMGDPVLIRIASKGGDEHPAQGALLRQFIEPRLYVSNSKGSNAAALNGSLLSIKIIGKVASKIFRSHSS